MKRIAVIGAGISGLTSAYALKKRGHDVALLEAGSRVGGVIETVRKDGFLAECGPNTLLETSPKIGELIRDLGLEDHKLYPGPEAKKRYIVKHKQPVAMPASPLKFFSCPLFSVSTKFNLLIEPFIAKCPADKEESLADFVLRRLGQEFLDYAINPFVAGVYAGDPHLLSVQHAFPKLYELEQKYGSMIKGQILGARERKKRGTVSKQSAPMVSFTEGLQQMLDGLEKQLQFDLTFDFRAAGVVKDGGQWKVLGVQNGQSTEKTFDAVLMTAPAFALADLNFPEAGQTALKSLNEIRHPPVASVVLGFKRKDVRHPLDGFGMLVPEKENLHILGTLFTSSLFPGRAPEDCVTLTTYVGGMRQPELALLDEGEQLELILKDLKQVLGVHGEPRFKNVRVYQKAIPQYVVGYGKYKTLLDDLEAKHRGVYFAGNYRTGISLSDSIVNALEIAERIHRDNE